LRRGKLGLNERLNGYELGFGSGLSPNGSDPRLTSLIQLERRVCPIGRLAGPARPSAEGEGKQASRVDGWVSAHSAGIKRKSFLFSKSFYNLQTNLNSIQIQISMTSTHKNKI
jgi:hypothetical protein